MDKKTYSLCEAVADIAYLAGRNGFRTDDSREGISLFIQWAEEFERENQDVEWGIDIDMDYIDEIIGFTLNKIKDYQRE